MKLLGKIDLSVRQALFVRCTKELVDALLALNTHNRKTKESAIEAYQKDMVMGTWVATNQGIGVSTDRVVIDGQNRLIAMQRQDYPPVEFLLVVGLPPEAQRHVDTHSRRTQTDILRLTLNQTASNTVIAALNCRHRYMTGSSVDRLTIDQLAEIVAEHHGILTALTTALKSVRKAAVLAALFDYALLAGAEKALALAGQIGSGELLERNDPAFRAREVMLRPGTTSGSTASQKHYRMMISACVADYQRRPVTLLKETDAWPRIFGQKVDIAEKYRDDMMVFELEA